MSTNEEAAMENVVKLQALYDESKKIGEEIHIRHRDLQQKSQNLRTVEIVTKAGKSLLDLWQEFLEIHQEIDHLSINKDEEYFTKNYFGYVEGKAMTMKANIEKVVPGFFINTIFDTNPINSNATASAQLNPENKEADKVIDPMLVKRLTIEYRTKCEMVERFLEKILKKNLIDSIVEDIEFMLRRCEHMHNEFTGAHSSLMCCDSADIDKVELAAEFDKVEDKYQSAMVMLEVNLSKKKEAGLRTDQFHDQSFQFFSPNSKANDNVKLPKIEIPKFDGDYAKWPEFRDLFSSLIHEKTNVPNVQKLQYLKMNLTGTAAGVIKHLQINGAHYEDAWNALFKRFNNNKMLINNNLKRLFSQKYVNNDNADELRALLDTTKEIICTLKNLGEPIAQWNSIIVFVVSQRMPPQSTELWENLIAKNNTIPPFDELESFLENRFRTIEMIEKKSSYKSFKKRPFNGQKNEYKSFSVEEKSKDCPMCKAAHNIFSCPEFNKLQPAQRLDAVKKMKLCTLCLQSSHSAKDCKSEWACFKCKKRHNTRLHFDENKNAAVVNNAQINSNNVLLATAIIRVKSADGCEIVCRALIDQGSMTSIITDEVANRLRLRRTHDNSKICGISGEVDKTRGRSVIEFCSRFDGKKPSFTANVVILKKLTSWIPNECLHLREHFDYLKLADPSFDTPGKIDVLLGADMYKDLILDNIHKDVLLAQNTHLGWILSGSINKCDRLQFVSDPICFTATLDQQMKQFWEIEEKQTINNKWSSDEQECERFYTETTTKGSDGRYIVRLPFKKEKKSFGRSRHIAISNLINLEKKFRKNPSLKTRYNESMMDYFQSGHAVPIEKPENYYLRRNGDEHTFDCFYLPHLAVIKEESSSTKTRVVFDASRKSSNGVSLNDALLIGPTIQRDIVEKILDFRLRRFAFTCDIMKMYRQIKMNEADWPYQRFVWRENEHDPIQDFCLTTVTFGEASAPHSAIRTMEQLARDNADEFPYAADILFNKCYVDDVHQGSDTLEHALKSRDELIHVTNSAGFELRKWASNTHSILADLPTNHLETGKQLAIDNDEKAVKTLGLYWTTTDDSFQYKWSSMVDKTSYSKRELLASIAKLYDPMGWIQPLIITPKIIMQDTWKRSIGWDEQIPNDLLEKWTECASNLKAVESIKIPRWIHYSNNVNKCQLHGFADASQVAYGAVVYVKSFHDDNSISINLLIAKSRVAPLKAVTIPRLELCAAVLLCELFEKVSQGLRINDLEMFGWSDSQIVLAWLKAESPNRWKAFVKNRVIEIGNVVKSDNWNYVNTKENPADLISRGCSSSELNSLWWNGPEWLPQWQPAPQTIEYTTNEEASEPIILSHASTRDISFLDKYSSHVKACRVVGWMLRFTKNCKNAQFQMKTDCLTEEEITAGRETIIKMIQEELFSAEISSLQKNGTVDKNSSLYSLCPFIDGKGIIRVGGRLNFSDLPFEHKHPIIFPHNHSLTRPMIFDFHRQCLHGGIKLTLSTIRQLYWLPQGTKTVKSAVNRCVRCARNKPQLQEQLMGQLPPARVNISKPFCKTGVDFAGPIYVKTRAGRGAKGIKAYVCVFVCMSTKAVHMELVGALTSTAFIAAFRRFIARRGSVEDMFSDNGTNFIGAFRQFMKEWEEHIVDIKSFGKDVENFFESEKIKWHFIPASSPNFGGLWEANVKALKHHVRRVVSNSILTYEELSTVLAQVENVLNSRPLCPLTDNIEDINALTPNHFLTGRTFVAMPETNHLNDKECYLTRWQLCQRKYQEICASFKLEYLNRLQHRPKWAQITPNIRIGQLFLIKDENKFVNRWTLGRVLAIHPGEDGLVRVATLRTKSGTVKRSITKLSPLPVDVPYSKSGENIDLLPIIHSDDILNETERETTVDQIPIERPALRRSPRFTKPTACMSMSILISLLFTALAFGKENSFITPFAYPAGMHFKSEGSVYLFSEQWKFIIQHNVNDLRANMKQIEENILTLNSTCDPSIINCDMHIATIQSANHRMLHQFDMAFDFAKRNKRNPIALVAVGALAGIGVYKIGQEIYDYFAGDDIDELRAEQYKIKEIMINQTSALNMTAHILDEMDSENSKQIEEINTVLKQTNLIFLHLDVKYKFMEIINKINRDISRLDSIYNLAINSLIHRETFPSAISTLNIINAESHLANFSQLLPSTHQLPKYTVLEEILHIPLVKVVGQYIQFIFEIPIISRERAFVYELIPIPVISKESMLWVQPNTQYIAIMKINSSFSEYHALNFNKQCRIIGKGGVCHIPFHPRGVNQQLQCEIDLFTMHSLPDSCVIHSTTKADTWIYIQDDVWGYVVANVTLFDGHNLTGSGLITFGDSKIDYANDTIIISDDFKSTKIISPAWNLSDAAQGKPLIIRRQFSAEINKDLDELHHKIGDIKTAEASLNMHDFHHYAIPYVLFIIIAIILCRRSRPIVIDHSRFFEKK